jgi:SAM-dependent methyltransferase
MRVTLGHVVPPRRYEGIPGRVHLNDFMFDDSSAEGVARYRERALNVIALVEESLEAAQMPMDDVERWLDVGCGYGRVVRFLVERVSRERVFACDVVTEGVDFCASEFGVHPLHSQPDLENVVLGRFDFVYAISVVTHLNRRNSQAFLRLIADSLNPAGIALFTTHGRWSLEHPEWYGDEFRAKHAEIAATVEADGMCFLPYRHLKSDEYGMAWHSSEYIEREIEHLHGKDLRLLQFEPQGLDEHQDVFAFQRRL